MERNNSLVCCGLDPDIDKIPAEFCDGSSSEDAVRRFLETVVDLVAPHVCAFKAQKAFFDIFPEGHELLRRVIHYVHEYHPELPIFVDAKIGDVENTMDVYIKNIFGKLNADGVLVSPYLGDDVMAPFRSLSDKVAIVTVRTSNPGAAVVQDVVLDDGRPFWKHVLDLTVNRWNDARNMIPVIASTTDVDLSDVRKIIPDDMPILLAGYGVQGGSTKHLRQLLDSKGYGVFVNSSRGLLYPYDISDSLWRESVLREVKSMQSALNFERSRSKFLLLLGVSGVGKSTLIGELRKIDERFVYISPFMTRELRPGETDKIPITMEQMSEMEAAGKFLVVNDLYDARYATPREPVERAFTEGKFPLLDWPITRFSVMSQSFPGRLFSVYIEPQSREMLRARLADGRDQDGRRLAEGFAEIDLVHSGACDDLIDCCITSVDDDPASRARSIYESYLRAVGP
ncbi:MAG: orotidine-5'-phosphate decarboxylase [Patescibacteria group bacterium]